MVSKLDFDRIVERRGSDSVKWHRYNGRDILPLWVADMDFPAPPAVISALQKRVEHGIFGYGRPLAKMTDAVIRMLAEQYHWNVSPEWLIWLPGLVSGLNLACRSVGNAGDDVMTTTPAYPPFLSAPELSQRRLVTTALVHKNGHWTFDFDALAQSISSNTGLFILCNPHNPTGRVYTEEELAALFALCRQHDMVICSDEIHCQLILDSQKRHIPLATLGEVFAQHTITLMAPSKTYNIPGLSCSFAIIPNTELRRKFKSVRYGIVPEVNVLGFAATMAAYQECDQWLKELLIYLRHNRDMVTHAIADMPGLCMDPVEATYLAWIDARETGLRQPAHFFERNGIGLSDGKDFGAPGYVRLNFGCPRKVLEKALARMQKALEKRVQ